MDGANKRPAPKSPRLSQSSEPQSISLDWQSAADRLQATHQTLRDEVHRLTAQLALTNQELAQKNRLADLGRLASHVAREVRNNLAPITPYLNLLERRATEQEKGIVQKIQTGFDAVESAVSDLLAFAVDRQPVFSDFAVCEVVTEVVDSLRTQLDAQGILVEMEIEPHATVSADRGMFRRAVLNLTINALDVMPAGGELNIVGWQASDAFELEIADSGPGVDRREGRLFEPFFTTKPDGAGLGLAIVHRIVQSHGGTATCVNCPQGGAAFTLSFPRRAVQLQRAA